MALVETAGGEETPDHNTPSPQGEKTAVQKQTYTRWMNVFLKRCDPPLQIQDLFVDVCDGRTLMALLEELSGCKLLYRFRPPTHRIFRLNNIAKALAFLDDRHVKLLGIEASAVADGVPHVVLSLLWNIISFFQIKGATGGLKRRLSSSLSSLPTSPSPRGPSPPPGGHGPFSSATLPPRRRRPGRGRRFRWRPLKSLLLWVQRRTASLGVEVWDFGQSWRSGLAFLALIQSIDPGLVDLRERPPRDPQRNLEEAFRVARDSLGIPALLEPQDVACSSPDERSIVTYLSMFLEFQSAADEDVSPDGGGSPDAPELQDDTPAEPGGPGETPDLRPEAEVFLRALGETSEQLLWKRWSRRSSGEPRANPPPLRRTSSAQRTAGDASPPRPNGTGAPAAVPGAPAAAASWIEEASEDHHVFRSSRVAPRPRGPGDGLYRLSALDSDEEDAFSYILDLQREHPRSDGSAPSGPPEGTAAGGRGTSTGRPEGERRAPSPPAVLDGRGSDPRRTRHRPNLPARHGAAEEGGEGGARSQRTPPDVEENGLVETVATGVEEQKNDVEKMDNAPAGEEKREEEEEERRGGEQRDDHRDVTQEEPWVTGSDVLLEAVGGGAEEEEGRRKRAGRPRDGSDEEERAEANAAGRPASDSVFREGSERARGEASAFRGRFREGVTSSTSPGRVSDQSDDGERAAEVSEHGRGETGERFYECVTGEEEESVTDEEHVGSSSGDVSGRELEVLFGLWVLLFCYFLFPETHF